MRGPRAHGKTRTKSLHPIVRVVASEVGPVFQSHYLFINLLLSSSQPLVLYLLVNIVIENCGEEMLFITPFLPTFSTNILIQRCHKLRKLLPSALYLWTTLVRCHQSSKIQPGLLIQSRSDPIVFFPGPERGSDTVFGDLI